MLRHIRQVPRVQISMAEMRRLEKGFRRRFGVLGAVLACIDLQEPSSLALPIGMLPPGHHENVLIVQV